MPRDTASLRFPEPGDDPAASQRSKTEFLESAVLSKRAAGGDQEAFRVLYERHFENVMRSLAWRLKISYERCYQEYEDVVLEGFHEAFVAMRENRYTAEDRVGAFRNWVATICHNNARDQDRKRRSQKRGGGNVQVLRDVLPESAVTDLVLVGKRHASPTQILGRREDEARLDAAIQELRDKYRQVLDLRLNCRMSYAEIAAELSYEKDVTVRSIYHRAIEMLQEKLAPPASG